MLPIRAVLLALAWMVPAHLCAQRIDALTTSAGNFARDRSIAVLDRPHPEFDPQGIAVSSFILFPKLDASARFTDNLFASDRSRRGDVAGVIDPAFRLTSNWTRHALSLAGDAALVRYARDGSQNVDTYDVNGQGQLDVNSQIIVRGFADYSRQAEQRSDIGTPNNTVTPVLFNLLNTSATAQWQSSRIKLVAASGVSVFRFQDNALPSGVPAPQGFRDRNTYRTTLRAEYALTPDMSLLAQGTTTFARFTRPELSPFNRNSDRQELLGGISLELTQFIRAEIGVGYIHLRYTRAQLASFSGIGARAQVAYFLSPLTTVSLKASRTIEDAGLPVAPSYIRSLVAIQADHELLRNLTLSASAQYSNNNFDLQHRTEHRPEFFARAVYTIDRRISLTGRYDHIRSRATPDDTGKTFSLNQFAFIVSARI